MERTPGTGELRLVLTRDHRSVSHLKLPVLSTWALVGEVIGRLHRLSTELMQAMQQPLTRRSSPHITPVQTDRHPIGELGTDGRPALLLVRDAVGRDHRPTQQEATGAAVAKEVQRTRVGVLLQVQLHSSQWITHLSDPHHVVPGGLEGGGQPIQARCRVIDDHQATAQRRWRRQRTQALGIGQASN